MRRCKLVVAGAVLAVSCLALSPRPLPAGESVLRAGFARVDITPAKPVLLAGYGSRKDPSTGVHDPLSARVAAFERDGRRLVLVSVDNLGFYGGTAEPLRKAILDACRLEPPELFLAAIHTHSAPALTLDEANGRPSNVEYTRDLGGKLAAAVRSALDGLAPAEIAAGSGAAPVGANRREVVKGNDGKEKIVLGRNPSVPIDREVQVLRVSRPGDAKAAAVLFAFPTHSTSLGPGNLIVSGDVHGLAEQFVERILGGGVIAPAFAGASGNIDPWFRVLPGFDDADGRIPEPILLGTMLGEEVVAVTRKLQASGGGGPIRTLISTIDLPAKPAAEDGAAARPPVPLAISAGRVGEIAFVGLGCEAFNEIGREIKNSSPFPCTFVFTHCNGAAGYLPVRSAYPAGGYEIETTRMAPGADEKVIQEARRLLGELRAP
jgi:neutral ceramidase